MALPGLTMGLFLHAEISGVILGSIKNMIQFDVSAYFSNGVVTQPPTRWNEKADLNSSDRGEITPVTHL